MPPRFAYWTILIDNQPTAFRARDQQELLPTLAQLKRTNQHVALKWFAHGKLWESPEAQRAAEQRPRPPREKRDRDWRPGGQHKDPRARFDKEAHRREKREKRTGWDPSRAGGGGRDRNAHPSRPGGPDRGWRNKPKGPRPEKRPRSDRPWREGKDRPRGEHKPWQTRGGDRPRGERKPWQKPPHQHGDRPRGDRPHSTTEPRRAHDRRAHDRPWRKRKHEPPDEG